MTDPVIGQLWVPESAAIVREDILTDIKGSMYADGVTLAVTPGTDTYIKATAFANAQMVQYAQLANLSQAITPLYSTGADLERWRVALGLPVVEPSPSTGAIRVTVSGTANIPAGTALVLPNGRRLQVFGSWPSVSDQDEIDVVATDTGEETNAEGGTVVRFVSAPLNVDTEAEVSYERPLDGGFAGESEARKLQRILNRIANGSSPSGWGSLREIAFAALASVVNCYVYPCLGGPAGTKIVPVRGFTRRLNVYTRAFSNAALAIVRNPIQTHASDANQYVVQAAADQNLDVSILITIPASRLSGGNGSGWLDAVPWPPLTGSETRILISAVDTDAAQITVDADDTTGPIAGQTHISRWSTNTMAFVTRLITAVSGGTGAWVLTLESPMVDAAGNEAAVGDYVSPGMENAGKYADTWVAIMESLGPGENISGSVQAPRDSRRPFVADTPRSGVTTSELLEFQKQNPEVTDIEYSYRSATAPTVPATIDDAPNIFVPRHFGIYQQ